MADEPTDDPRPAFWAKYTQSDAPFGWTQWSRSANGNQPAVQHGPGPELLDGHHHIADLGCAAGIDAANLARLGHRVVGVDVCTAQITAAREMHANLVEFVCAPAESFLAERAGAFDACYSIFGAVMHTDPDVLLPVVRNALRPGGKLVFSHAQPLPGCAGRQGLYAEGFRGTYRAIYRWLHNPPTWRRLLRKHGFEKVRARLIPAPLDDGVGTVLVEAHVPPDAPMTRGVAVRLGTDPQPFSEIPRDARSGKIDASRATSRRPRVARSG